MLISLSTYIYPNKNLIIPKNTMRQISICHDIFLILWNTYIFSSICYIVYDRNLTLYGNDPEITNTMLNNVMYHFWISKYYDYFDTLIIILNGNYSQLSYLHIFHHMSVSTIMFYNYKLIPNGGDIWFLIFYNSFIHILLYYYYYLTATYTKKKIWWAKYLTTFQIIQFVCGIVQQSGSIITNKKYPSYIRETNVLYSAYMLYLFTNFYYKKYYTKKISLSNV